MAAKGSWRALWPARSAWAVPQGLERLGGGENPGGKSARVYVADSADLSDYVVAPKAELLAQLR